MSFLLVDTMVDAMLRTIHPNACMEYDMENHFIRIIIYLSHALFYLVATSCKNQKTFLLSSSQF